MKNSPIQPIHPTFKDNVYLCMQTLTNFPFIEDDFDAITNYELLCKVVEYLNNLAANDNVQNENILALANAFNSLKDYVDNYFENLDIQEEVNNKLDEMVRDGSFDMILDTIVQPYFTSINENMSNLEDEIAAVDSKVTKAVGITPIPVESTSDMSDTSKIYLNTTNGKWYYYDEENSEWTAGGDYQAAEDSTKVDSMWNTYDTTYDYNLFNPDERIQHALLNTHGEISYYDDPTSQYYNMCVSPKLDVSGADYIVFNYMKPTTFCLYDESDTLIQRYASADASIDVAHPTYVNDTQAKYMLASYNEASASYPFDKTQYYLTDDSTDTLRDYVPYNNIIIKPNHLPLNIRQDLFKFEPNFFPAGIKQAAWRGIVYAKNPSTGVVTTYATENSYPCYRLAGEEKMDFLWLAAVRYTNDDEFYIMHDASTGRTCTTDITVASSSSEQMDAVRLKQAGWITWSDDDLKVPTLEKTIKLCYKYNMNIGIRLGAMPSNTTSEQNKAIWDKLIGICERYHLDNVIYSGTVNQCDVVTSYHEDWFVLPTGSSSNTEAQNLELLETIHSKNYVRKGVILYKNNLTETVIAKAHEYNIYVFAVGDEPLVTSETLAQYENLCVDAIITHSKIDL